MDNLPRVPKNRVPAISNQTVSPDESFTRGRQRTSSSVTSNVGIGENGYQGLGNRTNSSHVYDKVSKGNRKPRDASREKNVSKKKNNEPLGGEDYIEITNEGYVGMNDGL